MKDRASTLYWIEGVVWGLGLLLFAPPVHAGPLTLDEAYRSALATNERVQTSQENIVQARQELRRARSFALPVLRAEGSYTRAPLEEAVRTTPGAPGQPDETTTFTLQAESSTRAELLLDQPLFSGGRLRSGLRLARRGIEVSRLEHALAQEDLLFDVAGVFYEVLKGQADVAILEQDVERLREHRRQAETRVRVGEATKPVLLRAEAELAGAEANWLRARSNLQVGKERLGVLTGLGPDVDPVDPPAPPVPPVVEPQLDEAIERRPDLARAAVQIEVARDQIDLARSRFFPSLGLEGRYTHQGQDPETTFTIENTWSAALRLEFPLFEGGLRMAEWRQARSRARQAHLDQTRLQKQAGLDVRQARVNLEVIDAQRETLQRQVAFARENYELVSKQFTFGLATSIEALDAAHTLADAERQLVAATYDLHLATLALQKSLGVFGPGR